jgi:hypothetical protein
MIVAGERAGNEKRYVIAGLFEDTWVLRLAILVFALNLLSAGLFIVRVDRPIFDDPFNYYDVRNYAVHGFNTTSLLSHRNPPGPTSFVWMAAAVRLLGGNELRDARFAVLFSWVLLGAGVFLLARTTKSPEHWYAALLALLVYPHAVLATASLLTEGPALLFGLLGALLWTKFAEREYAGRKTLALGLASCLLMGLAVTCRQYCLALFPSAAVLCLQHWRNFKGRGRQELLWSASALLFFLVGLLPIALLAFVWKGFSSPGMATGASYEMYKAAVGMNLTRPLITSMYVLMYLLPLTFPLMVRITGSLRWWTLLVAVAGGVLAGRFFSILLNPGPLKTAVGFAQRIAGVGSLVLGLLFAAAIYNAAAVGRELWCRRATLLDQPSVLFGVAMILFYVGEQIGVGGNIPFYDRYVLLVAPFMGLVAFALLPRLDKPRLLALAALSLLSHFVLWHHAFGV